MSETSEFTPEWPPNWVNVSGEEMRSYSSPDSILIHDDGILRCAVSNSASTFVSVFGPMFMVFIVSVCWLGIDDFRERVAFVTLGIFCGGAALGLVFALMKHHENRGDYCIVDSLNRQVRLPRYNREFCFEDIQCLQILTGRDKNDDVINNSDLNLLVDDAGEVIRFHLMGNPNRSHAGAIGQEMETCLVEQHVPSGWYRSSDRQNI